MYILCKIIYYAYRVNVMCLDVNNIIKFVTILIAVNNTQDKICYLLYIFMYIYVYKCIFYTIGCPPTFLFFSYFNVNLLLTVISYVRLKSLMLLRYFY